MFSQDQSIMESLKKYVSENMMKSDDIEIIDFSQSSSGWSDESYVFSVRWFEKGTKKTKAFVVRKLKKGGLMSENKNLYDQYKILDVLSKQTDLPVPKVYCFEQNERVLGSEFFVMEKLDGKSYVPWSKEGKAFFEKAAKSETIPAQFVHYLASLHNVDYPSLDFDESFKKVDSVNYLHHKISELENLYLKYKVFSDPIMTDALEWLKRNKPKPVPLCIIHNDYRTGNMLFKDDRITGILDLESAEIGDPRMDVAYVCSKANRMDSPLLCYLLDREWFLSNYREKTKLEFSEKDIHYFEVYHQVRFLLLSLAAAYSFLKKGSTDLRMARQGFRLTLMRDMLAKLLGY